MCERKKWTMEKTPWNAEHKTNASMIDFNDGQ